MPSEIDSTLAMAFDNMNNNASIPPPDPGSQPFGINYNFTRTVIVVTAIFSFSVWFVLRCRKYGQQPSLSESTNSSRRRRFSFAPEDPLSLRNIGLEARVAKALPVFEYKAQSFKDAALECAICLSEFQENEKARLLPNCKHSFHIDCIDMWFYSHSTCPICRTGVRPKQCVRDDYTDEISINVELISFRIDRGFVQGETSSPEARNRCGLTICSMPETATDMPGRSENFSGEKQACSPSGLQPSKPALHSV